MKRKSLVSYFFVVFVLFLLISFTANPAKGQTLDIKPCYECIYCVIDPVTLEPVPPEGVDADWVPCSDTPSINLCSNGLTVVGVIDFGFEIVESTEATFLGATSIRYSVEDVDHDGDEDDLIYFFITKDLDENLATPNGDGSVEACLEITTPGITLNECDSVVLFSKGRCEKGPRNN